MISMGAFLRSVCAMHLEVQESGVHILDFQCGLMQETHKKELSSRSKPSNRIWHKWRDEVTGGDDNIYLDGFYAFSEVNFYSNKLGIVELATTNMGMIQR